MRRTQLMQPETLFDDDTFMNAGLDKATRFDEDVVLDEEDILDIAITKIAEERAVSYGEARHIHSLETGQYKKPELPEGASVELGVRALALSHIMATYSQLNRATGAEKSRDYERTGINARYAYPNRLLAGMGKKATRMTLKNEDDLNSLNATSDLLAVGFDLDQVELYKEEIRDDLLKKSAPGRAFASERRKVLHKVKKVANLVNEAATKQKAT